MIDDNDTSRCSVSGLRLGGYLVWHLIALGKSYSIPSDLWDSLELLICMGHRMCSELIKIICLLVKKSVVSAEFGSIFNVFLMLQCI